VPRKKRPAPSREEEPAATSEAPAGSGGGDESPAAEPAPAPAPAGGAVAAPKTSTDRGWADAATAKRQAARSVTAAGVGDPLDEAAGVAPGPDLPGLTAEADRSKEEPAGGADRGGEGGGVPAGLIAAAGAAALGLLVLFRRRLVPRWLRHPEDGASGPVA
jgi:hypothetical protein